MTSTPDRRVRIAFFGCGTFATDAIWPSLRYAAVDVAAAYSRSPEKAEMTARRFGAERGTSRAEEILEDETIEAAFIVGPPEMQHDLAIRALMAGKHVFVEKPPAPDLPRVREIEDLAATVGRQVQVGFQKRYATSYRLARERAYREDFGGVRLLKINYSHWKVRDWRHHLTIMSIHALDLARFFLGPIRHAELLKSSDREGRNICVLTMLATGGQVAILNLSATDPHVQESVEISGAGRLISVRNLVEVREWSEASTPTQSYAIDHAAVSLWHPEFAIPYRQADSLFLQGYAGEVEAFASAIAENTAVTPSIADATAAMQWVEAIDAAPEGFSKIALIEGVEGR